MASGCILDKCIGCGEFVWEDEPYEFIEGRLIHQSCLDDYRKIILWLEKEEIDEEPFLSLILRMRGMIS
jgi:hypothetical protein